MSILHSVRSYRKQYSLTQSELGLLLGLTQTRISRLEKYAEPATIEAAFCLQVIFGVPPHLVFRDLYDAVEAAVLARVADLDRKLKGRTSARARRKQHLIADIRVRLEGAAERL